MQFAKHPEPCERPILQTLADQRNVWRMGIHGTNDVRLRNGACNNPE